MDRYHPLWRALCVAGISTALAGCRPSGAVRAALHEDLPTLRETIAAEHAQGKLDEARTRSIAEAVLEREVYSARGAAGTERVSSLRSCARPLYDILQTRAETPDDVGAEAAMVLYENNRLRESPRESYTRSDSGAWRAVAARDSAGPREAGQRIAFFEDPDERVRRAALRAAAVAGDPGDLDALLETARLDPDPVSRSLAIGAIGSIGGEHAVLSLKDRWERSEEPGRIAIVSAWARPASLRAGGKRELLRLVETGQGFPALHAAQKLSQSGDESAEIGTQALFRTVQSGTREEKRLAIRLLPADHTETPKILVGATKDDDPEVRLMAQARLLGDPKHSQAAQKDLRKIAQGKDSRALQARAALAAAGDETIAPLLLEQLEDKSSSRRRSAAIGLLRLGRSSDAATILADPSPSVRTDLACQMVAR